MSVIHNELRRIGRLQRGVQDTFGLEEFAGVERIGETLTPTFDILNAPPEYLAKFGIKLIAASVANAAVALENSHIGIRNPTGSGKLVTVVAVTHQSNGDVLRLTRRIQSATDVDTTGSFQPRDSRFPDGNTSSIIITATAVGILGGAALITFLSDPSLGIMPWIEVLHPGNELLLSRTIVNTALTAGFIAYERPGLPLELVTR